MSSRTRALLSILKMKGQLQPHHHIRMLLCALPMRTNYNGMCCSRKHRVHYRCFQSDSLNFNNFALKIEKMILQNSTQQIKIIDEDEYKKTCVHNVLPCSFTISNSHYQNINKRGGIQMNRSYSGHNIILSESIHQDFRKQTSLFNFCHKRFYSKDGNLIDGSRNEERPSDIEIKEVADSLQNDPWLKSLLSEIRQDFDSQKNVNDKNDVTVGKCDPEDKSKLDNSNNSNSVGLELDSEYEYDYRYAGDDDIEEFGYFDEADIIQDAKPKRDLPISLIRGSNGVFELEELISLMEHLGCDNIVSVPIPPEANYCDHMVIVTAQSRRHLQAVNDEMLWVHKRKKAKRDPTLVIEGKDKSDWCAMDMGNLVLHIFLNEEKRQYYDIESLWLLGPENDPKCQQELEQQSFALSAEDLYWMEVGGTTKDPVAEDTNKTNQSS